jgi:uncharacterized RDD family membrane protein YckC
VGPVGTGSPAPSPGPSAAAPAAERWHPGPPTSLPPPPGAYTPPAGIGRPYRGFWLRLVAYLIDGLILTIPLLILAAIIAPEVLFEDDPDISPAEIGINLLAVVGGWLYQAIMESSRLQATLGKLAVGARVTDLKGRRISFARATGRHFAQILSGIILLIGYIMIAFSSRKQGLHDHIAGTLVYKADRAPQPPEDLGGDPSGWR